MKDSFSISMITLRENETPWTQRGLIPIAMRGKVGGVENLEAGLIGNV